MSIRDVTNKRGRPPTTGKGTPITVRLLADQLQRLDDWIEEDGGRFTRPEAIRRLLEHAWGRTVASKGVKPLPPRLAELPPRVGSLPPRLGKLGEPDDEEI